MNVERDLNVSGEVSSGSDLEKYFDEGGDEKWCRLLVDYPSKKGDINHSEKEMAEVAEVLLKSGKKPEEMKEVDYAEILEEAQELYFDHLLGERGKKKNEMIRMAVDFGLPQGVIDKNVMDLMEILMESMPDEMSEDGKNDFQEYVWRDVGKEKKRKEKGKESDLLYESYDNDEEWIDLARREFREREERKMQYGQREFDTVGLEAKSGVEVPMFKHMTGREELAESLKEEGRARLGIHNAFVAWKSSCGRPEEFLRAFGFSIKDQEKPDFTAEGIDLMWLKSLSEAEGGLGEEIGKALALYIKEGEKSEQAYNKMKEEKRKDIEAKMDDKSENIFSQPYQQAMIKSVRERIAKETSVDGEEIAYRLMYLFGLAAKYSYSQKGNEKDGLGVLFRVNDFWQNTVKKKGVLPAPEPIVGDRNDLEGQPFNKLTFLLSYPEMVGEVLLKDGKVKNLIEVLRDGDFSQVRWEEVDFGHGGFLGRVEKALSLRNKLSALTHKPEDVSRYAISGLKDIIEKALEHERGVKMVKKDDKKTANGEEWKKTKMEREEGEKDYVTQWILYYWAKGVISRHSPLNNLVPLDDYWGLEAVDTFTGNLSEFLSAEKLRKLRSEIRRVPWAWNLGSKRAERF